MSANVLYGLFRYWAATRDDKLLFEEAVELVVEVARYYAHVFTWDPAVSGYGIRRVMCFDEYHFDVDHHLATNQLGSSATSMGSRCAGCPLGESRVAARGG